MWKWHAPSLHSLFNVVLRPPPPRNLTAVIAKSAYLQFTWNPTAVECPTSFFYYSIMASSCGSCPLTTTSTNVTCSNVPANGGLCVLSIRTEPCGGTSEQVLQLKGITIVKPGSSMIKFCKCLLQHMIIQNQFACTMKAVYLYNSFDLIIGELDLTTGEISGITIATAFLVLGIITMFFLIAMKGTKILYSRRQCHKNFGMDSTMPPNYEVLLFHNDLAITLSL